jgi:dTDP-glucose 4,6-dehydratase
VTHPLAADLDHVLAHTAGLWDELRGGRLFITGGTGFVGRWLLESLVWASDRLSLDLQAVVLSRRPARFARVAPHLAAHRCLSFFGGDVRSFPFPDGSFTHLIHAAAESGSRLNRDDPVTMWETIALGTRRTLDLARKRRVSRYLLLSSGAVYGRQPPELLSLDENCPSRIDATHPLAAYALGKQSAEWLTGVYGERHRVPAVVARGFAFVGPYLPLDAHFAAGNFLRDALRGGPIVIEGDGTPFRSYLYAADLAAWLWHLLLRAQPGRAYNVGGSEALSIAEVARLTASLFEPPLDVQRALEPVPGRLPERYVPCTQRAERELGLRTWVPLPEALQRTLAFAWQEQKGAAAPHDEAS